MKPGAFLAFLFPLAVSAQLGGLVKTQKLDTKKVETFVDETEALETQVDSAGDLLYAATDEFFAIVDSAITLPSLSEAWSDVKSDLNSAVSEEKEKAAQENYLNYLKETDARKSTLDSLWEDNTVRQQILTHLVGQKDNLAPIKDSLERALEKDKAALTSYDEVYTAGKSAVSDLISQVTQQPLAAASAKSVLEEGKQALTTLPTLKETATRHVELASYILDKLKEVF